MDTMDPLTDCVLCFLIVHDQSRHEDPAMLFENMAFRTRAQRYRLRRARLRRPLASSFSSFALLVLPSDSLPADAAAFGSPPLALDCSFPSTLLSVVSSSGSFEVGVEATEASSRDL